VAAARVVSQEFGFTVVGIGTYSREHAREVRDAAKLYGVEPLITDDYLDVEARVAELQPELVIVGDGPERHEIRQMVAHHRLQDRVALPGKIEKKELMHLFDLCDVFCLPSIERTEAFGLVLLEAMYFGKALITTMIPGSGVNEVNEHAITGLQVPPADPHALAKAIIFLKTHPETRIEMGKMGRARFKNHFDIQPVASRIETIYNY